MGARILHHTRTYEPGPEQEHADQDNGEAEIFSGFFREPAATQNNRLSIAAAGKDAQFLLLVRLVLGELFLPLSLAFCGALFLGFWGLWLRLRIGLRGVGRRTVSCWLGRLLRGDDNPGVWIGRETLNQSGRRDRYREEQVEADSKSNAALFRWFVVLPRQPSRDEEQGPEHRERQARLDGSIRQQPEHRGRDDEQGAERQHQKRKQRNTAAEDVHVFSTAKIERDQPRRGKAGSDRKDTRQARDKSHAKRNRDADEDRPCRPVEHNHQHQRTDRIAEKDVAFP